MEITDTAYIVECLKCNNRFISWENKDENIVCKFCDNTNKEETIFLIPEEFERCDCQQCEKIKEELRQN